MFSSTEQFKHKKNLVTIQATSLTIYMRIDFY